MNPGTALPAILDYHPGGRFSPRWHGFEFSKGSLGQPDLSLGFELLQNVIHGELSRAILIWRANLCYRLTAVGYQQGFTLSDDE
jgi:hypothetical protein